MREKIGEVILHLSLNSKPLRNGKFTPYIRVQHKALNRHFSCHSEFTLKEWQRFEKYPENDHPVMVYFRQFCEATRRLIATGDFTFSNLSSFTRRSRKNSIQDLVRDYRDTLSSQGKHKTASLYGSLAVCLDTFLGGRPLPVTQLTRERCTAFLAWLHTDLGNGPTTVNIKARQLTAVLEKAVKDHLIPQNPMKSVSKPTVKHRYLNISTESLAKLLNATPEDIGEKNFYWLQFWVAVYYGNGMNIKDLLLLRRSNIRENEIVFIRHKIMNTTAREVHIPITEPFHRALSAISGGKTYIIPLLDGYRSGSVEELKRSEQIVKLINKHLRETCRLLGIPEKVTTATARHTFATRLLQLGVPIQYVSDAMGHSRISTTEHYFDGYTVEQRRQAAELLKVK